jgi:uncharacterized protein YodC (DUF2158 family)
MQPGDLVLLKSGSPLMTVLAISQGGVVCTWFDKSNHKTATFPEATLEPYVEPTPGDFMA